MNALRFHIVVIVFMCSSCIHVYDNNEYDPLIPPYSFIDTCSGEYSIELMDLNHDHIQLDDGSSVLLDSDRIIGRDAQGDTVWMYENEGRFQQLQVGPGGHIFAYEGFPYQESRWMVLLSPAGEELLHIENQALASGVQVLSDGRIAAIPNSLSGTEELWLYDLSGNKKSIDVSPGSVDQVLVGKNDTIYIRQSASVSQFSSSGDLIWRTNVDLGTLVSMSITDGITHVLTEDVTAEVTHRMVSIDQQGNAFTLDLTALDQGLEYHQITKSNGSIGLTATSGEARAIEMVVLQLALDGSPNWKEKFGTNNSIMRPSNISIDPSGKIKVTGFCTAHDGLERGVTTKRFTIFTDLEGSTCY